MLVPSPPPLRGDAGQASCGETRCVRMAIRPRAVAIMLRLKSDFQATRAAHRDGGDTAAPDGVEMVIGRLTA